MSRRAPSISISRDRRQLLRTRHLLGDTTIAATKMWLLLVRVHSRDKFEIVVSRDSSGASVRRWRHNPSRTSIFIGPIAVVKGIGRSRREARKLYCLPAKATPAKPSMTLRLGCQPSPTSG